MVKVSVDNGYLRILGKSCLRIPDTWAKLSADTGYRQKAVSAPVSMDTWGSMCHPDGRCTAGFSAMCDPATQQMDLDEPEDRRSELEEVRRGNLFDEVRTPHRTQHAAN